MLSDPHALHFGARRKDPMIVCEDADLENAARAAVWGILQCGAGVCLGGTGLCG